MISLGYFRYYTWVTILQRKTWVIGELTYTKHSQSGIEDAYPYTLKPLDQTLGIISAHFREEHLDCLIPVNKLCKLFYC